MDPFPASSNISAVLLDWDSYDPGNKGYVAPYGPGVGLPLEEKSIQDNFREIRYDPSANDPVLSKAVKVATAFPSISVLGQDDDVVSFPLSKRESSYLSWHYGIKVNPYTLAIPSTMFRINNPKWATSVLAASESILSSMRATNNNAYALNLIGLTIKEPDNKGYVSVGRPASGKEYATIFILLPSRLQGVGFTAVSQGSGSDVYTIIPCKELQDSAFAVGVYNGTSNASLNVFGGTLTYLTYTVSSTSPSVPDIAALSSGSTSLRDIFCGWRAGLSNPASTLDREVFFMFIDADAVECLEDVYYDEDAILLANVAPLAKAYGFRLYIGCLTHELVSPPQQVLHPYKEHLGSSDDIDTDELDVGSNAEEQYTWRFLELSGAPAGQKIEERLQMAAKRVEDGKKWVPVNKGIGVIDIDDCEFEPEFEIVDDGPFYASVIVKEIRHASFLIVVG
ncbi:hypothetical protein CYLTODRAFT_425304 [Cylindrobasidium torrendii FP15055 ss-10]|uniref:Uncharacterized protein n=1 Tax=Cylindrobasidium torrendii FP15055 ss-10 TaxID=1314674 RepID=A0A0D7B2A9_9AGAR|nr:hypothetical protein CYLTODRAFT_425304 [Cylindrobasidium torrendii FP15055 ss-10]